jgi:DNA polymerase I-like protein with 3'-5' exonuclease and polymerase domains
MWDSAKYMAFDFETSGTLPEYALQPWRIAAGDTWATSLATVRRVNGAAQVGGGLCVGSGALPPKHYIQAMLQQAIDEQITLVAWNALFDISILIGYGFQDMVFQCKFLDAMLLWKHVHTFPEYDTARDKKFHYGLKAAVAQYIPTHAGYEADVDFHSTDPNDLKRLHNYNVLDSALTLRLAQMFYTQLAAEPPRLKAALIEAQCLPLVAWANWHGIPMDRVALTTLGEDLTTEAAAALIELAPHGITEKIVRSPKQLSQVMFHDWGLPVLKQNTSKKTGKTTDSTDKEVLHELSFIDPRAKYLRQYREALGNKTKFVDAPETSAEYNGDGKSHPLAIVFGTYTGRMTYSSKQGRNKDTRQIGFALHQEKREERFRDIAIPPEGYTLVEFDAAGQEYRWMAIASGDPAMQHLCMDGEDPHTYMGAQIAQRDYIELMTLYKEGDKDAGHTRKLGKFANFSCAYRTRPKTLRAKARVDYGLPMELPQAAHIHSIYPKTYPNVPKYWSRQIEQVKRLGYAETFAGRRVQVQGSWSGDGAWSRESTAINYPIQGTGADQKYLALAVLRDYIVKRGIYFAWELHDGLYSYVPTKILDRSIPEMRYLLNNLPYKKAWGFTPPIPLPWDCKASDKSWGQLKEVKV